MTAHVLLGDVLVGYLEPEGDVVAFRFDAAYLDLPGKPVLGQEFEDRVLSTDQRFTGSPVTPLPTFFRNALPEGALRKVVEASLHRSRLLELDMLVRLGADLPGALRVIADPLSLGVRGVAVAASTPPTRAAEPTDPIRFSLSGVQLKASVSVDLEDQTKITLPLIGQGGRWIAKFSSAMFRDLPENELTMLRWARAAGLDVPDHRIIEAASIQNLPAEFSTDGRALLVERFDRSASSGRIHQEDFAQVFAIEPEDKDVLFLPQGSVTYAGIGSVVRHVAGAEDYLEFLRRVVFMILSGNADAHAKNWSLVYPDGVHARLSPLYDVVATVAYESLARTLPLGFVHAEDPMQMTNTAMEAITYRDIRELAEQVGESAEASEGEARAFVERARVTWKEVRGDAPSFVAEAVDRHLARVAL